VTTYRDVTVAAKPRIIQEAWMNLSDREADAAYRIEDRHIRMQLKQLYHSTSVRDDGASYSPSTPQVSRTSPKKYTACDSFCGAGFATQGAKDAGLKVTYAFDHDPNAMRSYRRNHHDVKTLLMSFFDFLQKYGDRIKVDVLMLSFPCQFFAICHTVPGRNDEANEVAMLGLGDIIAKMKPRLVVIEQTSGMDFVKFRQHLMAVVAGFRNNDYSIRKAVINFAGLGLPSQRKRLIFIGAAYVFLAGLLDKC
jgi:DNA (cytosine-5)-methyltransferase 1